MCVLVTQSRLILCNPIGIAPQAPLSMEFFRQEYWSRLPFPTPGDFPDPGIKPMSLGLLHWQADSLPLHHLVLTGNYLRERSTYLKGYSLIC